MPRSVIGEPPQAAGPPTGSDTSSPNQQPIRKRASPAPTPAEHHSSANPQEAPATAHPPPRRSWAGRFGEVILRGGIAPLPFALFYYQGELALSAQEVWLIAAILATKWDAELPHPSLRALATQAGISLFWLKQLRSSLEGRGLLQVQVRHGQNGGQAANSYDFGPLFAQLESLLANDPAPPNAVRAEPRASAVPLEPGTHDMSFVARYGRVLVRAGIATIPQALFRYQKVLGLTAQQLWFISYILAYKWDEELPYPSLKKMAARTGYSERHIHNIKSELVECGYVQIVARHLAGGGQDNNGYDFSGLFTALTDQLEQDQPAETPQPAPAPASNAASDPPASRRRPALRRTTQAAAVRPKGGYLSFSEEGIAPIHPDGVARVLLPWNAEDERGVAVVQRGGVAVVPRPGVVPVLPEGVAVVQSPVAEVPLGGVALVQRGGRVHSEPGGRVGAATGGSPNADEEESAQAESNQEENSNLPIHQKTRGSVRTPRYSPFIAGVVLDLSRELGDSNGPSNVTQALRLWQASGLGEQAFVEALQAAKRGLRKAQTHGVVNKGAYWMAVLRDQLGLPTATADAR